MTQLDNSNNAQYRKFQEAKERALAARRVATAADIATGGTGIGGEKDKDNNINSPDKFLTNPFSSRQAGNVSNLPIPLPVEIRKDNDNGISPIPLPVDIQDVARESTQKGVIKELIEINHSIIEGLHNFKSDFSKIGNYITKDDLGLDQFKEVGSDQQAGWFTKFWHNSPLSKMIPFFKPEKTFDPLIQLGKKQLEYLQSVNKRMGAWLKSIADNRRDKLRESAIDDIEDQPKGGFFKDAFKGLIPDDSFLGKLIKSTVKIASFYAGLGSAIGAVAGAAGWKLLMSGAAFAPNFIANVASFLKIFSGLAGFFSAAIGLVLFSPVYAAIRDPEQLGRYLELFGKVWSDNIQPTLKWMATKFVPDMAIIFAGLGIALDIALVEVGSKINNVIIPVLEAMSNWGGTMGKMFNRLYDYFRDDIVKTVQGENTLSESTNNFFVAIGETLDIWFTDMAKAHQREWDKHGIPSMMRENETFFQAWSRRTQEDLDALAAWWNAGWADLNQTMNNFFLFEVPRWSENIKNSVIGFIEGIVNIIPTWEDIKGWMRDAIRNVAGGASESIIDMLGLTETIETIRDIGESLTMRDLDNFNRSTVWNPGWSSTDNDVMNQLTVDDSSLNYPHRSAIDIPPPRSAPNVTIYAPTTNNNSSSRTTNNSQSAGRLGVPSTSPQQSPWTLGVDRLL